MVLDALKGTTDPDGRRDNGPVIPYSVFRISARALIAAARRDARVAWAIAEELNRRLYEVLEQTAVNAFGSVRQCVAAHLLDLASGRQRPGGRSWPTAPARVPVPAALPGWGSANPQGKALLRHYSNCSQKGKALLTLPPTGGNAGSVGYGRRGVSCGWTICPAPGHSAGPSPVT
jgi:hypothetical protein